MKSGYRSFRPFAPPSGFHHLLAVFVPWIQGLLFQWALAPDASSFLGVPYNLTALLFGLGGSLWKSWRSRRHTPWIWGFWAFSFGVFLAYTSASFILIKDWSSFYALSWEKFTFTILLIAQILASVFWQGQLTHRARIFFHSRSLTGDDLKIKMREYHEDGTFSQANRRVLGGYLLVSSFLFLGLEVLLTDFRTFSPLYLGLIIALAMGVFSLTGIYRQEIQAMTWGLRWNLRQKTSRGLLIMLVIAGSLMIGFSIMGSYKSVTFFTGTYAAPPEKKPPAPIEEPIQEVPPMPEGQPGDILFWINRFLRMEWINWKAIGDTIQFLVLRILDLAPFVLGAFLLVPIIRAMIKGRFDLRLFRYYWVALLNQIVLWIRSFLSLFTRKKPSDVLPIGLKNSELWLLNHYGSRNRKGRSPHHSYLVQGFLRLLDRGGKLGVTYFSGQTTDEFLRLLGNKVPSLSQSFLSIAELIDQGLFSGQPLSPEEKRRFLDILNQVLNSQEF